MQIFSQSPRSKHLVSNLQSNHPDIDAAAPQFPDGYAGFETLLRRLSFTNGKLQSQVPMQQLQVVHG